MQHVEQSGGVTIVVDAVNVVVVVASDAFDSPQSVVVVAGMEAEQVEVDVRVQG